MKTASILVVTGASGAGKTTAVKSLEKRAYAHVRCHYFDSLGVPSLEAMRRDFGGPEAWQLDATRRWIERLTHSAERDAVHVLDGQTRPSFVLAAAQDAQAAAIKMVLLDASPTVRRARLAQRGQSELATVEMDRWASYLLDEADAHRIPIVNTDALGVEGVVDALDLLVEASWVSNREHP